MKKFGFVTILFLMLFGSSLRIFITPSFGQSRDTGLVGYWNFEEGSGLTASDGSGNNNIGTLVNGPVWTEGKFGAGLNFEGVNDFVSIPDSTSLRVQSFTLESWIFMEKRPYQFPSTHGAIINKLHYLAVNTWVLNMKDNGDGTWTVKQELTQKGTADIYDITGATLLDTVNFRVVEVTHGTVNYLATWYHVSSFQFVEKHNYRWIITGVYHYHVSSLDDYQSYIYEYWVKGIGWTVIAES